MIAHIIWDFPGFYKKLYMQVIINYIIRNSQHFKIYNKFIYMYIKKNFILKKKLCVQYLNLLLKKITSWVTT